MKNAYVLILVLIAAEAHSDCPPAPISAPNEPVLQLSANADGLAAFGRADRQNATEEGAVVWNAATKSVVFCNGVKWVSTAMPTCSLGETLVMGTDGWLCECVNCKTVFVTSTKHTGNLGGQAGADAICQSRASAAGLAGTFLAWISEGSIDEPRDRFTQSSASYRRVDGTTIASNWDDLIDGHLFLP